MKPEYHEGQKALERFNKLGTQVFRAPKTIVKAEKPKPPTKPKKKNGKD